MSLVHRLLPVPVILALAPAVLATLAAPDTRQPHTFLRAALQFSNADLAAMDRGQVIARLLKTPDKREIGVFGIVRVRVPRPFMLERFRDIARFKASEMVLQIGQFGTPPRPADVAGLTLEPDDIEALRDCRIGNCDIRLTAPQIRRAAGGIDWSSPAYRNVATALVRAMLVDTVTAYLAAGNAALDDYQDRKRPVKLGEEFRALLGQPPSFVDGLPAFQRYLTDFPRFTLPGVDDFVYWSKEKFGFKPVISLTHVSVHTPAHASLADTVIVSRQIYASHYFDGSVASTMLIDDARSAPAFYMMYLNRTRVSSIGGAFGWLARSVIQSRTRTGVEKNLRLTRERLEADYAGGH